MQITIYSNFSKEANSTKQPSGGTAVNCTLKEDTSVLNPVFILDMTDASINYVSWVVGGITRYYFVTDIVYLRNTTIEVHCKSDPMATFKAAIGASSQYVTRAASEYDQTIIDTMYPMLPESLSRNIILDTLRSNFDYSTYVIGVVGQNSINGVTYYALDNAGFSALINALFLGNYLDAPTTEISKELQKELVNPFQYVVSAMWFPFQITGGVSQTIKFGFWDTGVTGLAISDQKKYVSFSQDFQIPAHPQLAAFGRFLGCNPYTQLLLHCFSFGDIVLPANMFSLGYQSGTVFIQTDVYSGVGELRVYTDQFNTGSDNNVVQRSTAQIGVPIQLSQVTQNLIQSAVGVVGSLGAIAQGNFIGVLSGVGDAVNGLLPQVEKTGAYGSRIAYREAPTIHITTYGLASPDREHLGSPLMAKRTINTLSGYVQVERPDVDIIGTVQEKDEIVAYMQGGFYYE